MFARVYNVFFLLFVAFPLLAAASAIPLEVRTNPPSGGNNNNQCNVGSLQCCNSVQQASSANLGSLFGLVGGLLGPVTGLVGLTCNPISVIGVGGNSCNAQPVCCSNNSFNGIIALGCSPININL